MESTIKHCVINAGIGAWYPQGTKRIERSLNYHGFVVDFLGWNEWPNDNFDKSCIYHMKASAFEQAINAGYKLILWMDCSAWAIKSITPIFDIINTQGYYFQRSGYNCAQTCNDFSLNYFGINRDTAETYHDTATGVFGVNLDNPQGLEFITRWINAEYDGVFIGSRHHDSQSTDPRFLFHRQDQSAASLIINQMQLNQHNFGEYVTYYSPQMPDSVCIALQGM